MRFSLRTLLPSILAASLLANVALRFLPPEIVAFRPWEAVFLFRTGPGPFAPNKRFANPAVIGDLANLANLPNDRHPHPERFTTGSQGFRMYDAHRDGAPRAVILGDSFGGGAGVSDETYLGSALTNLLGGPVYWAGHLETISPEKVAAAPLTILQLSERTAGDSVAGPEDDDPLVRGLLYALDWWRFSPLDIWSSRAYRTLQNEVILPNPYARNVQPGKLLNGDRMLFLPATIQTYLQPPSPDLEAVLRLRDAMRRSESCLVAMIVPDKFEVYRPLLTHPIVKRPDGHSYLKKLEQNVREAGIPVLNLQPVLRARAAEAFRRGEYIYHLDDSHWNAKGVSAAAQALAAWLPTVCSEIP